MNEAIAQSPEIVTVDLPPEPPIGSIAFDRDGTAWQSKAREGGPVWASTGPRQVFTIGLQPASGITTWPQLVTELSPLTIVHRRAVSE